MGVQGLTSLLDADRRIYRELQLRRRRLVIDGCNLLFPLYLSSGLDQNRGGDYAAFEEEIEKFVAALRRCEIEPYVVIDGGADITDNKLETLKQRAESNIRKCHQAAVEGREMKVLPLLSRMVLVQTLDRLQVPLAQCYGEADPQVAALACEWQCPVLSDDSDFFIFNLPAGLLPVGHFQWKSLERSGRRWSVPCRSYHSSQLCTSFSIRPQLLPTFAALAPNTFVKRGGRELHIRWEQFDPTGGKRPHRLRGLLSWLSDFRTPQAALEAALRLMGNLSIQRRTELLQNLTLEMEMFQLPPSSLESFFIRGTTPLVPSVGEEVGVRVPDWMRCPLMQARLSGDIRDVLQLHRKRLSMPVDHEDMPSAARTSRPIRQLVYGLLLGRDPRLLVDEWDRDGLELVHVPVRPVVTSVTRWLDLRSLNKVALSERLQVMLQALKVTEASLSGLPPQLRLPVAVTCYWLQKAEPAPDPALLRSLLLWLSDGDALRHAGVLQPEHQEPELDWVVAHALNQWQMCLKDSVQLNHLLSCPLPDPHIARLYEGTLVHWLVHRMRTTGGPRDFLKKDLYQSMLSVAQRSQEASRKTKETRTSLWRQPVDDLQRLSVQDEDRQAEMRSFIRAQNDPSLDYLSPDDPCLDYLSPDYLSLDYLSPDDPCLDYVFLDYVFLDYEVTVKTRYKTKARNNRCKNPELTRKVESRRQDLL